MDPKFVPSKIIESAPVGPLSTYIEPYIAFVSELGFAPRSVYEQIRVIVMFSLAGRFCDLAAKSAIWTNLSQSGSYTMNSDMGERAPLRIFYSNK